jgi:hypothetical protein
MILKEAKIQKRNLLGAAIAVLLLVGWIIFGDPSFSRTMTFGFVGATAGYLSFAIVDYRDVLHQIFRPADPNRRRIP